MNTHTETLSSYCKRLGWSVAALAREAQIDWKTANKALQGQKVDNKTARDIASALSTHLNEQLLPGDIGGLNYE